MRKKIFKAIVIIFVLSLSVIPGELHGQKGKKEISITISKNKAFPFPANTLGVEHESFEIPYVSDKVWKEVKNSGVGLLRYPCGTPSDHFLWDAPKKGYWGRYSKTRKKCTPDQFLAICKKYKFDPIITVNTSSYGYPIESKRISPIRVKSIRKGAKYAAKWVDYMNNKKTYGVKYWEIGNEVWIWLKASEYPVYINEYAKYMRKASPEIKIIACGLGYDRRPFYVTWLDFPDDPDWQPRHKIRNYSNKWNRALLKDAKGSFDYLALHIYLNSRSMDPIENGLEIFAKINDCPKIDKQIELIKEYNSPVKLAITEWCVNSIWYPIFKNHMTKLRHYTLADSKKLNYATSPVFKFFNTLLAADFLGKMISSKYIKIAVLHDLNHGLLRYWDWKNKKTPPKTLQMPCAIALEFWNKYSGDKVIELKVNNSPVYRYRGYIVPFISAYATVKGKNKMYMTLINRSPDKTFNIKVPMSYNGKKLVKCLEHAVYAKSWSSDIHKAIDDPKQNPVKKSDKVLSINSLKKYKLTPSRLICLELDYK